MQNPHPFRVGIGLIMPGYNTSRNEQEALRIRNSFLSDICDINGFYDSEIVT